MLQPTFYRKNGMRSGLTQVLGTIVDRVKSLLVACLFVEKCRFCGRELALAADYARSGLTAPNDPEALVEKIERRTTELAEKKQYKELDKELEVDPKTDQANERKRDKDSEIIALNIVPPESSHRFFRAFAGPTRALIEELNEVSLAATHAKLVPPALIYFAKHPSLMPRLSECLCNLCWEEIEVDLPLLGFCPLSGLEPGLGQQTLPVASGVTYDGKAKELIRAFKYQGDATLAADLASLMSIGWSALSDYMPASKIILVPVPLHNKRKENRGYNQAELLARELGKIMDMPVAARGLRRVKATKSQQLLARTARLENVRHAFAGDTKLLTDKTVVLVDDVCTSGATLVACAEEALRCGARSVVALTVARAVLTSTEKR